MRPDDGEDAFEQVNDDESSGEESRLGRNDYLIQQIKETADKLLAITPTAATSSC